MNEVQSTRNFMDSTFLGKYHKLDSWDYGNTYLKKEKLYKKNEIEHLTDENVVE